MGYTTSFSGTIELSKALSLKVAKEWIDAHDSDGIDDPNSPGGYLQWVPTEDLRGIVWDGGEKFYDYTEWMEYVVRAFIIPSGIVANGQLLWSGEDTSDNGVLSVVDNVVKAVKNSARSASSRKALTRRKLSDMILEAL